MDQIQQMGISQYTPSTINVSVFIQLNIIYIHTGTILPENFED